MPRLQSARDNLRRKARAFPDAPCPMARFLARRAIPLRIPHEKAPVLTCSTWPGTLREASQLAEADDDEAKSAQEHSEPVPVCNVQVAAKTWRNVADRHDNEDRWIFETDSFEPTSLTFHTVGVLDGHDTAIASDRVSKELPRVLGNLLKEGYPVATAYAMAMEECEETLRSVHASAGTCVLSCTVAGNHVWCANLGDCRAGLFSLQLPESSPAPAQDGGSSPSSPASPSQRKPKVERLVWMSHDHKASDPEERRRILRAGGNVVDGRVCGLEPCRTLGDFDVKANTSEGVISIVPEVRRVHLGGDLCSPQAILVCATDGVWDVLTGQDVCNLIAARNGLLDLQNRIDEPEPDCSPLADLAADLVQFSVAKGSRDDCTAVVAMLSATVCSPGSAPVPAATSPAPAEETPETKRPAGAEEAAPPPAAGENCGLV